MSKGMRPLTNIEIEKVSESLKKSNGMYSIRNYGLFMLGVSVGGRISEMLSLTIGDVWDFKGDKPIDDFYFRKEIVKGKEKARRVPINADGRNAIGMLVGWQRTHTGSIKPSDPLFLSRKRGVDGNKQSFQRKQAERILKQAFENVGLTGRLNTHTLRKSFATRVYNVRRDIAAVQEALGHASIVTTRQYLGVDFGMLRSDVERIAISAGPENTIPVCRATDEELMEELLKRGYNLKE